MQTAPALSVDMRRKMRQVLYSRISNTHTHTHTHTHKDTHTHLDKVICGNIADAILG